jgi:ABC-type microcin C transport system permease subunit YejB
MALIRTFLFTESLISLISTFLFFQKSVTFDKYFLTVLNTTVIIVEAIPTLLYGLTIV